MKRVSFLAWGGWRNCRGQSLVEAVVVLALVAIVAITVLRGISQTSMQRLHTANEALDERRVADSTAGASGGVTGSGPAGDRSAAGGGTDPVGAAIEPQ